jgi:uncharacterized protein YecA (UPF0149 family)
MRNNHLIRQWLVQWSLMGSPGRTVKAMAEEYEVGERIAAPSHRYCIRHWCPVWLEWLDKFACVLPALYNVYS